MTWEVEDSVFSGIGVLEKQQTAVIFINCIHPMPSKLSRRISITPVGHES